MVVFCWRYFAIFSALCSYNVVVSIWIESLSICFLFFTIQIIHFICMFKLDSFRGECVSPSLIMNTLSHVRSCAKMRIWLRSIYFRFKLPHFLHVWSQHFIAKLTLTALENQKYKMKLKIANKNYPLWIYLPFLSRLVSFQLQLVLHFVRFFFGNLVCVEKN